MQKIPYASTVGSLMYAQVCTRPDIAFIVGVLGRYLSNPGMDHWRAAKRVMRYLKKTRDYMLTYRKSDSLEIIGYSDSDFGGCQDTGRSTLGYVYILAGGAISWKSVKQTLVASSNMAAEFVACYEASNHGIWLRNFVTGLRIVKGVERPLKLFCDNNSAIEHIGTNSMLADPLTKALVPKVFHEHTKNMGVVLDDTTGYGSQHTKIISFILSPLEEHPGFCVEQNRSRESTNQFAPERNKVINDEADNLLKTGKSRELKYPNWLANIVVMQKKNGKWRVCIDFIDLNKACPKDPFPLPHRRNGRRNSRARIAHILMHKDNQEKTAFMIDKGIYCYKVMPFGLKMQVPRTNDW
ncbi:hypothetical protein OSB04_011834 [Centaurea solstitialis]|uniref:Retrovirus-related Pol polyprotein from transposon TNT 1-94 n=1 Tax=Centaurea solstitialis TaxID=347529 RepID=A0AA38TA76_9ASTR|nr:hypothetical protein OSB04_011834 [Centaurea solstitialis]